MITVTRKIQLAKRGRNKRLVIGEPTKRSAPQGRVPRIAKLMALAIRFDQLLRDGVVSDLSELARLAQVTQPRMTQIMNLLHLAPDIQEELLHLPVVEEGNDPIHERHLRPICAQLSWKDQRRAIR